MRRKGFRLLASQLDDVWSAVGPHLDRESFTAYLVEGHRQSLHIGREEVPVAVIVTEIDE